MTNIKILGIGGCGISILNRIIESGLSGVDFAAFDYDTESLGRSKAPIKLELKSLYSSLLFPETSSPIRVRTKEYTLKEDRELREIIGIPDAVIIIAGLGGVTGSGAIPIITELAKESGALTVAVVTWPFTFEGEMRRKNADDAIAALTKESFHCTTFPHTPDKEVMKRFSSGRTVTLFAIPCDHLLLIHKPELHLDEAFNLINRVMAQSVRYIVDFLKMGFLRNEVIPDEKQE